MGKSKKEIIREKKLELLKKLIDRANYLPSWYSVNEVQHGDFDEVHSDLYEKLKTINEEISYKGKNPGEVKNRTEKDLLSIEARLRNFKQHVLGNFDLQPTLEIQEFDAEFDFNKYVALLYGAFNRFNSFVRLRKNLQKIARFKLSERSRDNYLMPLEAGTLIIDQNGVFKFKIDLLTKVLEGVNVDSVKECKFCKRIFWAKRKKSKCCPPDYSNCNINFNTRKSRGNQVALTN